MKQLTLISNMNGITAAAVKADAAAVAALNTFTASRGLVLTERDAREVAETRLNALKDNSRLEIGVGVVEKIILIFSTSPYVEPRDWAELINTLVESFYFIKTETHDAVNDNDLIKYMLDEFEGECEGSIELLAGRMEALIRKINGGEAKEDADEQ